MLTKGELHCLSEIVIRNCFVMSQKDSYCIHEIAVTVTLQKHLISTQRNSPLKETPLFWGDGKNLGEEFSWRRMANI